MTPIEVANEFIRAMWEDQEAPIDYDETENTRPSAPQELIDAIEAAMKDGWTPTKFAYGNPEYPELKIGELILIPVEDWVGVQPTLTREHSENIENAFNEWFDARADKEIES
jgi:hypothetical protein